MLGGGILHLGLSRAEERWRQAVVELSQVREAAYLGEMADVQTESEIAVRGIERDGRAILKVETHHAGEALIEIIRLFGEMNVEILSIETLEPNLETVFLHLTGKSLRE
jgi:ABC-2 type transport system ATP-binding protein